MSKQFVFCFLIIALVWSACGDDHSPVKTDSSQVGMNDSHPFADCTSLSNLSRNNDTVFHTALPPVHDGDIIMQNYNSREANMLHTLMGGKYNHVGMIFTRKKDGILMVVDMQDTVRTTQLTDFVDRSEGGHVCLLRVKDANKTLNEEKTKSLIDAAKGYKGRPFDPVLNWDDSHLYSSELIWKIYNNAMRLTLCPTRTVADFDISVEEKKRLKDKYGLEVSDRDEAVSTDDIYNSPKLEIIYEK